jgi:multiple sugar transport system substrate-binding protein
MTLAVSVLLTTGAGCFGGGSTAAPNESTKVTLEYWRVIDGDDAFDDIINAYRAQHPSVTINYRKLRLEEYEEELIRALAKGEGPDIFSVHNTKVQEYRDLLAPMPAQATVPVATVRGALQKEVVIVPEQKNLPSLRRLREAFVDVALADGIVPGENGGADQVYALPMSVDTLALYSNRDLLNAAGIATPPTTWGTFQEAVTKITRLDDASGRITQSAVGLGTANNVERGTDILSVLMMQNGVPMVDDRGRVSFRAEAPGSPDAVPPALGALEFYTDFANPTKEVYTWNATQPNSFEAFANGQTAFFFGYSYHAPLLAAANPRLRFTVSPLPQIAPDRVVNYANYWLEAVSKDASNIGVAWDFLTFATSADQAPNYLKAAARPTAIKSLIDTQIDDEILGTFASQVLTAKSWYRGRDADAAEAAMKELITNTVTTALEPDDALNFAASVIAQTYD